MNIDLAIELLRLFSILQIIAENYLHHELLLLSEGISDSCCIVQFFGLSKMEWFIYAKYVK